MLKGKNINLRTMRSKDLETYLDLTSDIEARGSYYPLRLNTETTLRAKFNEDGMWSDDKGLMLIVEKESDRILGIVVFFKPTHYYNAVELGYCLFRPEDRGKGYMSEAVTMFAKYLFAWKSIDRIQIQTETPNLASRRVAEKCGFTHEGTMRNAIISNGRAVDMEMYSILRSELT